MSAAYNIAVIGQTGVGKSSLINYLFGEEVCKTGIGKPVTTNGFHVVKHHIKDMPVNIYDSWGLEVGKEAQWLKELEAELQKRGVDKSPTEWFHSVFYCISASGARIQDADVKIIKHLLEAKYKVSLILTRTDELNEEQEEEFKKAIQDVLKHSFKTALPIIPVCSTRKKLRGNQNYSEPFGKEEVEKQSIIDFVDSLILRIPAHCEKVMKEELKNWQDNMKQEIRGIIGFMGSGFEDMRNRILESAKNIIKNVLKKGRESQKEAINHYDFIARQLKGRVQLYGLGDESQYEYSGFHSDWWHGLFAFYYNSPIKVIKKIVNAKDLTINELDNMVDSIISEFYTKIDEQVEEIKISFLVTQEKIKHDFAV